MILIPVVGQSMSGKTTLAHFAHHALDIPVVCSYTTRQPRFGEQNGIDHYFVSEDQMPPSEEMLAYTFFGGHHYWVPRNDPKLYDKTNPSRLVMYVIDEDGIRSIANNARASAMFDAIIPIRIIRDNVPTYSMKAIERTDRDSHRNPLPDYAYYRSVVNDSTISAAMYRFSKVIDRIASTDEYSLLRWYAYHKELMT